MRRRYDLPPLAASRQDMAVDIEGDADVRVPEMFADDLDALFQEQGRVRVPRIVEGDHRQSSGCHNTCEVA